MSVVRLVLSHEAAECALNVLHRHVYDSDGFMREDLPQHEAGHLLGVLLALRCGLDDVTTSENEVTT